MEFAQLLAKVRSIYQIPVNSRLTFSYVDEDEDLISFESTKELSDLLHTNEVLRLYIRDAESFEEVYPDLPMDPSDTSSIQDPFADKGKGRVIEEEEEDEADGSAFYKEFVRIITRFRTYIRSHPELVKRLELILLTIRKNVLDGISQLNILFTKVKPQTQRLLTSIRQQTNHLQQRVHDSGMERNSYVGQRKRLYGMGFVNEERNRALLKVHNGDVEKVVEVLSKNA